MSTQRLPVPGGDDGDWGDILNGFLEVSHNADGTLAPNTVGSTQLQAGSIPSSKLDSSTQTNLSAASTAVQSVNGKSGTSVTLAATDVGAAPLASPAFTGTPTAPTATSGTNTTQIATTAFTTSAVGALNGQYAAYGGPLPPIYKYLERRDLPGLGGLPTVMTSAPTITAMASTSNFTTPVTWRPWEPGVFRSGGGAMQIAANSSFPNYDGWSTAGMYSHGASSPPFSVEFTADIYDSTGRWELITKANSAYVRVLVLVNGQWQYVSYAPTWSLGSGSGIVYGLVTHGAAGRYTIRIEFSANAFFFGVNFNTANDTASATLGPQSGAEGTNRRRIIVVGDSFTQPTVEDTTYNGVTYMGFPQQLCYLLNADVWSCGEGGAGYVVDGTGSPSSNFTTMIQDAISYTPDEIWMMGSLNDQSLTTAPSATITTNVESVITSIQTALPNCRIVVFSPQWKGGYSTLASSSPTTVGSVLRARDAVQAGAVAAGVPFLDLLSLPLLQVGGSTGTGAIPAATTLSTTVASGVTSISIPVAYPDGQYIQIDTGAYAEVRRITGISGTGPYTLSFGGNPPSGGGGSLINGHTVGCAITPCGPPFLTGTGYQGATTGFGNSDVYVGNDDTHPTAAGHTNLALKMFDLYCTLIAA